VVWLIPVIVAVIVLGYVVWTYNRLVSLSKRADAAWSDIDVQLKRRWDLVPALVETVKGYARHESSTLEHVVAARGQAVSGLQKASQNPSDAAAIKQLGGAESALAGAMSRLMVVVEAYPNLKANENMMQVSEELTSTENRVAFARQAFNDAVMAYNTYKQSFPPVIFAGMFGHAQDATLLEFEDHGAIQQAPKVSFT